MDVNNDNYTQAEQDLIQIIHVLTILDDIID